MKKKISQERKKAGSRGGAAASGEAKSHPQRKIGRGAAGYAASSNGTSKASRVARMAAEVPGFGLAVRDSFADVGRACMRFLRSRGEKCDGMRSSMHQWAQEGMKRRV